MCLVASCICLFTLAHYGVAIYNERLCYKGSKMAANISKEPGGLVTITGSGTLEFSDLRAAQNMARDIAKSGTMARVLVTASGFTGWGQDGDWGDLGFVNETDHYVSKIAAVGTEAAREQILMFLGAGRRKAAVQFFLTGQEAQARQWLMES
jgi:hypothetical protein